MKPIETLLRGRPRPILTDIELASLLDGTDDSRYGKVKRLMAQGVLIRIKKGLYCISDKLINIKPHSFELAQIIYGPSYISLESALSYHQLIPEAVYSTTSVTTKRAKSFQTPIGEFSYSHLPLENFYMSVTLIKEKNYQFFLASPWKAICDYIFCYKKNWLNTKPLIESLRINLDDLPNLSDKEIGLLDEYYHHARITRFLKGIRKDLML